MKVLLAKHAGFCKGVKRAVELAYNKKNEGFLTVYTDGPLIHNREMIQQLKLQNVHEINSDNELTRLASQNNLEKVSLLIRAHGITPQRREFLKSLKISLCDATCPDVAYIAGKITLYAKKGYHIFIFGDSSHPEVTGLMGYTASNGSVVSSIEDCFPIIQKNEKICLVSQSTMFVDDFEILADALKKLCPNAIVCNTICQATRQRQHDILELLDQGAKAIIVIGGKHSANTKKLVTLSKKYLPTFPIETVNELDLSAIQPYPCVGVTAGASTPDFIIQAVVDRLGHL